MLSHFARTRNGSVVALFTLLNSTETSSPTGFYVAVPVRLGQIEELASRNEERTRNKPSFFPKKTYKNSAQWHHVYL